MNTEKLASALNALRRAHESRVSLTLYVSTYDWDKAPYLCSFEQSLDGQDVKGKCSRNDPLDAILEAWSKFESLALRGNAKMLAPQLEAPREGVPF